jgi:hypothetical protein
VAPVTIHHRTNFAASMIDGRTVMELPGNSRSAQEIEHLWDYLDDRLARLQPHVTATAQPASTSAIRAIQGSLAHKIEVAR